MKFSTTLALLSSLAFASASFRYNSATNSFVCSQETGLAAYCAGGGIIIRCSNGTGYAGNCNDNLDGEPPIGNNGMAGCYQSSPSAGDAACTKSGLVYPSSGSGANANGAPYPIPGSYMPSGMTRNLIPTGTAPSGALITGSSDSNASSSYRWSNTTTISVSPLPAYATGVPSAAASAAAPSAPQAYTGAAAGMAHPSAFWAMAVLALVAWL